MNNHTAPTIEARETGPSSRPHTIYAIEVSGNRLPDGIYLRPAGGFGTGLHKAKHFATYTDADNHAAHLKTEYPRLMFWAAAEPWGTE